jgi:diguanylate cyclase (GGDEF)-like protein
MEKLIDIPLIKETSLYLFRMAFRWYNDIYSRKKKLSDDDLNHIFEQIHTKALEVYDSETWGSLQTDGSKFWYSENPNKEADFPLVPVLINYGNAILKDCFSKIAYPDEPEKATIELLMFFIYAYVRSMKPKENVTTLLSPELMPSVIDPIIKHLFVHGNLNGLSINLLIEILGLNNNMNKANKLEGLYNASALNKIWKRKNDDMIVGMIMLDGDKFKQVNDICGHPVGDEVLEIYKDSILNAIEMSGKLKSKAFPARWGGEEFCICVFDITEEEIIDLSKKIKSELESHARWEGLKEKKYNIVFPRTFSQGIALGKKSEFGYLNAIVEVADNQMYKAKKKGGRNCIYYRDQKIWPPSKCKFFTILGSFNR